LGGKIMDEKECLDKKGLGWRSSLSIIVGVGWLVFIIIWLAFYAGDYTGYQNVSIFILSILIMIIILGIPWAQWGLKHHTKEEKEMWKTAGFRGRVWMSMILMFIFVIFLIYWFWYQAVSYNIYQNIAIFIVSILIIGGVLGAAWAPWGIKHGDKFEKKKQAVYYHEEEESKEKEEKKKKE
jgi:hypothetical protein